MGTSWKLLVPIALVVITICIFGHYLRKQLHGAHCPPLAPSPIPGRPQFLPDQADSESPTPMQSRVNSGMRPPRRSLGSVQTLARPHFLPPDGRPHFLPVDGADCKSGITAASQMVSPSVSLRPDFLPQLQKVEESVESVEQGTTAREHGIHKRSANACAQNVFYDDYSV